MRAWIILFLLLFAISKPAQAVEEMKAQDYFASFRSNETNVRAGPGPQYPIKFTFKLRGIPVKVINEYDNWSEIKDYDGETGWVNQNLLTKKRTIMVKTAKTFINLHSAETEKARVILRLENHVIADFIKCSGDWCGIKIEGKKGWVSRLEIWGVDEKD